MLFKPQNTDLTNAISNFNPKLSRSSARTYASQIKSINKKFGDTDFTPNMNWYNKEVESKLLKIKKEVTKKNLLNAALIAMYVAKRHDDVKRLQSILKPIRDKLNYNQKKQTRTKREIEREINFPLLLKKYRSFARKIPGWSPSNWEILQKFTILSLYVLNPPVRLDYGTASLVKTNENNWVDFKNKVFKRFLSRIQPNTIPRAESTQVQKHGLLAGR